MNRHVATVKTTALLLLAAFSSQNSLRMTSSCEAFMVPFSAASAGSRWQSPRSEHNNNHNNHNNHNKGGHNNNNQRRRRKQPRRPRHHHNTQQGKKKTSGAAAVLAAATKTAAADAEQEEKVSRRRALKEQIFELAEGAERGFKATKTQKDEMTSLIDQLAALNPTAEPAWSFYSVVTRQLHLAFSGDDANEEESRTTSSPSPPPSLEGKWTMVYTEAPEITSLSLEPIMGLAKLGRIGQECSPFPDYTVKNVIELVPPEWAKDVPLLIGTTPETPAIVQKMTMRAKASPEDPRSIDLPPAPRGLEVLSQKMSPTAAKNNNRPRFSLVTDEGLVALNPLQPLRVGLQIAGFDYSPAPLFEDITTDEKDKTAERNNKAQQQQQHKKKEPTLNLMTNEGLVALNPFQPWKIGLQMAGFRDVKEPWNPNKDDDANKNDDGNFWNVISQKGLLSGLLQLSPIQLGEIDATNNAALASLVVGGSSQNNNAASSTTTEGKWQKQEILYLDNDIRILRDGQNHVTIDSRVCTDKSEDCWF